MQEYCRRIKSAETPRPASTSDAYSQSHSLWMAELPDIFIDISNGRVTWHFSRYKSLTYIYNWFTNYGVFVYTIYRIYRTLFISINLSPANLSFFYLTIKPAKRIYNTIREMQLILLRYIHNYIIFLQKGIVIQRHAIWFVVISLLLFYMYRKLK